MIDWTKWDPKLGTMHDGVLAGMVPCSREMVAKRREKLGIAKWVPQRRACEECGKLLPAAASPIKRYHDECARVVKARKGRAQQPARKTLTTAQIAKRTAELTTRRDVPGYYSSSAAMWEG